MSSYGLLKQRSLIRSSALALILAASLGGCARTDRADLTGSISSPRSADSDLRQRLDAYAEEYKAHPTDPQVAINYAQLLRANGQRAQAVAILQQASIQNPKNQALLGAYGRALADTGQFSQALDVLSRAHTPDRPDWRILNAQGTVLDQMGRNDEAQRYYKTALKIAPNEPSILSNLALSYALSHDLKRAESTLRVAVQQPNAEPKVRQNLALVLGLEGKFNEAETIAAGDLPPDEARASVAELREMMQQPNPWKKLGQEKSSTNG